MNGWMSLDFHQLDLTDGWIITCRYNLYNTSHPPDWEIWGCSAKHISSFVLTVNPVLLCVYSISKGISIVLYSHTWSQRGRNHPVLSFYIQVATSGTTVQSLFGVTSLINLECRLWNCAVLLQCAKGRGNLPSRRCWTARRRWGKRRASMRPVRVSLCGNVLFSTRLLYTPRSSRRSSGSLFRPDTRNHKCPQSPASTWSCSKRWRCVEASHQGQSSSKRKEAVRGRVEEENTHLSLLTHSEDKFTLSVPNLLSHRDF